MADKKASKGPSDAEVAAEFKALRAKAKSVAVPDYNSLDVAGLRKATDDKNLVKIRSNIVKSTSWQGADFSASGAALVHKDVVDQFIGRKGCVAV